jgi:hypothetical protein
MRIPTPEDVLRNPEGGEVVLTLRCSDCGRSSKERFSWACVHPRIEECRAQGWDGISLSRMFICAKCNAVDRYELVRDSLLQILAGMVGLLAKAPSSRVFSAEMKLWDGTQVRRPSQALGRLRELAAQHPNSPEAHRRLGNGCQRFGLLEEAVTSWRRAVELDVNDLDSLNSLAEVLLRTRATEKEGFAFLLRAVRSIPATRSMESESRLSAIRGTFDLLREFVEGDEPLALTAGWKGQGGGKELVVHASSVDLRDVLEVWDNLVEFVASPSVLSLAITNELPEEEVTQLAALLFDVRARPAVAQPPPVLAAPKVGRNEPCPCGSGNKFKRCCAA